MHLELLAILPSRIARRMEDVTLVYPAANNEPDHGVPLFFIPTGVMHNKQRIVEYGRGFFKGYTVLRWLVTAFARCHMNVVP